MVGHAATAVYVDTVDWVPASGRAALEGAEVVEGAISYDDAVARAAALAQAPDAILVQDMGWPGYEQIPAWIVEGYATLCAEADDQLAEAGAGAPSLVVVPVGVGSFAQAVVTHYRSRADGAAPSNSGERKHSTTGVSGLPQRIRSTSHGRSTAPGRLSSV